MSRLKHHGCTERRCQGLYFMIILRRNLGFRGVRIAGGKENPKELVAVDLTIGSRYRIPGKSNWFDLKKSFVLRPGRCALIRTEEKIELPNDIFASVFSRGSLSAKGIVVSNTKVDPLFSGVLHIPVFNAGSQSIELERGTYFCSIVFHTLEHPVPGDSSRDPVDMEISSNSWLINFLDEYSPHIIAGVITIIGSAFATFITIKYTPPSAVQQPSLVTPQKSLETK